MTVSETLKKAEDKLSKSSGVSLNFHLPTIELAIADIDSSMLFNIGQDEELIKYKKKRYKDSFWGSFCELFHSDKWGTEEYEETQIHYVVDLELKKQEINKQLESRFNQQALNQIADYLTHQFEPVINQHLDGLVHYLQQYLSILNNAIESHKLDETTKKALVSHLTELLKTQAVLKGDIDTVNKGQSQL